MKRFKGESRQWELEPGFCTILLSLILSAISAFPSFPLGPADGRCGRSGSAVETVVYL